MRETRYRDADKILTVLTESEGKLTVKARGALRKGCKFAAASQALVFSEMTLFGSSGRWSINEAETIEQFLPLREDIGKLSLASYFAEALESVSDEDSPNPEILQLGLNSLYALSRELYSPEHIKSVFEFRLMCAAGFEPELYSCAACGREPVQPLLSLSGGVLHCRGCAPGAYGVSLPVSRDQLMALRYVAGAPAKKIFSFSLDREEEKQLCGVCEAYMTTQLERSFGALEYWKAVTASIPEHFDDNA